MNNKYSIQSGIFWNAINSIGRLGLSFLATVFLSRILTPSDFGTYGVLIIFITIAELIADSGMGGYIVKQQNVDSLDYDTLFVYNLAVSVILYILLFISAPYIAIFYKDESLVLGMRLCGIVIIAQSISIIATARLQKELAFKNLAIISILSGVTGLIFALLWGYYIGGYFSLILQSIVSVLTNSFGVMWILKSIPRLRFDRNRFKKQFRFGINLMGSTMLQSVTCNISNNIIAKIFNMNLAGIYTQSAKLQTIPTSLAQSILDKTLFPVFSKLSTDLDLFNIQAYKMSRITYALCFPLMSIIIYLAKPIILIILGEQWTDCIKTFQILMLASFPMLIKNVNRNFIKSLGFTKDILLMEFYPFLILIVCVGISVYSKSYFFLVISIVLSTFVSAVMSIYYLSKRCLQKTSKLIKSIIIFTPFIFEAFLSIVLENNGLFYYSIFLLLTALTILSYNLLGITEYVQLVHKFKLVLNKTYK